MAMPADAAAPSPFDLEASMDVAMAMSSPTLSSSAAAAAAAAAAFILHDPHTALPALMPNKFTMLRDDSLTELEFQDIHRFLSQETSTEKVLTPKQNLSTNQPLSTYSKRNARHNKTEGLEALEKSFPSVRQEYPDGKENNPLPRRGFLRREGSGRITSHRPFKVDLRSFGSILNKGGLGDSEIPRDVHAFWEAEDEKEASEAIMRKVRGEDKPCSQQSELGNSRLRRPCVRRKGSQRRTKSRCIKLDLPFYAKQVQLLDKEQLEEEEAVNVESCTFSKHLELTMDKSLPAHQRLEISDSQPRNSLAMNSDTVSFDVVPSDDEMQIVLSDGDSPALSTKEDSCHAGNQTDINDSINAQIEDLKGPQTLWKDSDNLQMPDEESVVPVGSTAGQREGNTVEEAKGGLANAMKVTPYDKGAMVDRIPSTSPTPPSNPLAAYDKCAVVNRTPLTSPTPPSNPLAALGYKKGNFPEGMGKRKLDFEDTIDSPLRQPALQTSTGKDSPCLQKVSASPVKTVQEKSPAVREETSLVASEVTGSNTNKSTPQLKVLKKKSAKKKRLVKLRNSLEGAGTNWNNGVRRSTRIRSRPLEYWRGERFLFGRIHETLTTVIGIKYSSPPPCWPKRGAACPKFKVESYVSDKYADHIRLAALG